MCNILRSTCNIHMKQLQHTSETPENTTYICNIWEGKAGPVESETAASGCERAPPHQCHRGWGECRAGVRESRPLLCNTPCHLLGSSSCSMDLAGWVKGRPDLWHWGLMVGEDAGVAKRERQRAEQQGSTREKSLLGRRSVRSGAWRLGVDLGTC
jgi:hypothetical protein